MHFFPIQNMTLSHDNLILDKVYIFDCKRVGYIRTAPAVSTDVTTSQAVA